MSHDLSRRPADPRTPDKSHVTRAVPSLVVCHGNPDGHAEDPEIPKIQYKYNMNIIKITIHTNTLEISLKLKR